MAFPNKTAVITGAGSGMGRETAQLFADRGAAVAAVDIDREGVEETVSMIADDQPSAEVASFVMDVSEPTEVEATMEDVVDEFGGIDVLHNNAGILHDPDGVQDISEATWDAMMDVNLKGVFLGTKYAVPHMREQGEGVIVNTASTAAIRPRPGMSAYTASKGGVAILTKQLAIELASDDIRVNAVAPVATDTQMLDHIQDEADGPVTRQDLIDSIPLGRLVQPEEIAQSVAFLASEEAAMITGTILEVDGGRDI